MKGNTAKCFDFTRATLLMLGIVCGSLVTTLGAEAQCLRVTMTKGKAKLSSSPLGAGGKCPAGAVAVGAATGTAGAPGAQGPQGPAGPIGPRGASAFDVIPSGKTVYGFIGLTDNKNANDSVYLYESLPGIASAPLPATNVIVRANELLLDSCSGQICLSARMQAMQGSCPGTSSNPSAAPGFVCIYPTAVRGEFANGSIAGYEFYTENSVAPRVGFAMSYETKITGQTFFEGIWAYTAP